MPEIDTELFQWLVLGLLVLLVLIALISASILSKIAKQPMTSSPATPSAEAGRAPADTAAEPAATGSTPEAAEAGRPSWGPTYTSDVGTLTGGESAPAATAAEPTVTSAPEPAVAQEAPAASTEAIPEEEPFEREGRWWFKRGDELLVYDEGSGQWQPAPAGSFPEATAAAPATGSVYSGGVGEEPAATGSGATPSETAQPSEGQAEGGFWKCTSCGAINGATAASCRMCFTARP